MELDPPPLIISLTSGLTATQASGIVSLAGSPGEPAFPPGAGGKELACPPSGQALPGHFGPAGTVHRPVPIPLAPLLVPAGPRPAGPPVDPAGPQVSPAYVSGATLVASSRLALSAYSTMGHFRSHFERAFLLGQPAGPQGPPSMAVIVASPPGLPPVTPGLPGMPVLTPYPGFLYQARPSGPFFGSQVAGTLGQVNPILPSALSSPTLSQVTSSGVVLPTTTLSTSVANSLREFSYGWLHSPGKSYHYGRRPGGPSLRQWV